MKMMTPKKVAFGENIPTPFGGMIITPKNSNSDKSLIGKNLRIQIITFRSSCSDV